MLRYGRQPDAVSNRAALTQVKDMVRRHFRLAEADTVMVNEIECGTPGCPPVETVIAFWTEADKRHHLKIFKPAAEVVEEDLPPWWLKPALQTQDVFGCPCC